MAIVQKKIIMADSESNASLLGGVGHGCAGCKWLGVGHRICKELDDGHRRHDDPLPQELYRGRAAMLKAILNRELTTNPG